MKVVTAVLYLSFATTSEISDDHCRSLVIGHMGKDARNLALDYEVTYVCTIASAKDRMYKISRDNQKKLKREKQKNASSKTYERCGESF